MVYNVFAKPECGAVLSTVNANGLPSKYNIVWGNSPAWNHEDTSPALVWQPLATVILCGAKIGRAHV